MGFGRVACFVVSVIMLAGVVRGQDARPRVLVVPCVGTVGEGVTAKGLGEAFARAKRQKVERVILEVDSPGGFVYEADALIGVLREYGETFEIVTVVTGEALSAATVFLAGADAWVVTPGANVGAAVAFGRDASTGSVDVDAKFNSVWSASLAGLAEENGWSGDLFRAMVERGVTLYAGWAGEASVPVFSRNWPDGMDRVERVDSDETVLALNAGELAGFGLAMEVEASGLDAVAALMEWGEVRAAGTYGAAAMKKAGRERTRLSEEVGKLQEQLDWHMLRASQTDPRGIRLHYDRDTRLLTPATQRAWAERAQESLGHWTAAERLLTAMARLDTRAERAGAEHLRVDREGADGLYRMVSENVAYLRRNMRKTHYQLEP